MEATHVVGTVVAFVVVQSDENDELYLPDTDGYAEFSDPKEAFAHGGVYFKKISRPDGGFSYDAGFHEGMRIGDRIYGCPCDGCKTWTWRDHIPQGQVYCLACSDSRRYPDDIEQYDREW